MKIPVRCKVMAEVLLALVPAALSAQTTVSGRVTTTSNEPLQSVNVSIATLRVGANTNADGRYSFTVPEAVLAANRTVTLSARRIGYTPQTVTVTLSGSAVTQDFSLAGSPTQLAEVVVTALGFERERSRLGTAQQQVTAGEANETRAQNVMQQIQGKVSGVQITSPGTQGGSVNVIIRGQNSITGNNQPLFIVDGVAVSNANRGGSPFPGANTDFDYGNAVGELNPDDI